jgi:hypothetical protein
MRMIQGCQAEGKSEMIEMLCKLLGLHGPRKANDLAMTSGKFDSLLDEHPLTCLNQIPGRVSKYHVLAREIAN